MSSLVVPVTAIVGLLILIKLFERRLPRVVYQGFVLGGLLWEWCTDAWHDNYQGAPSDGSPWLIGGNQNQCVLRGGSWNDFASYCRCANRFWYATDQRVHSRGFRVVRVCP